MTHLLERAFLWHLVDASNEHFFFNLPQARKMQHLCVKSGGTHRLLQTF